MCTMEFTIHVDIQWWDTGSKLLLWNSCMHFNVLYWSIQPNVHKLVKTIDLFQQKKIY